MYIMIQKFTIDQLARMIDHTFVKAYATQADMTKLCEEAKKYHFAMVAINSGQTAFCHNLLKDTDIHTGAAIGFPLGQTTIESKTFEAKDALENGADEIDYQLNITAVKAKDWDYVQSEMQQITNLTHSYNKVCKVILETYYLEKSEIQKICEIACEVKIDFVKTSTGFGSDGAKIEDIKLMKETVQEFIHVKASGGIRDAETFKEMVSYGASRIGTSAGVSIIEEFKQEAQHNNGFITIDMHI